MEISQVILAVLGVAVAAGGITAYFKRSEGQGTIQLLQTNIQAYKDSEKLKDARILYLEGQIVGLNETIKNLNKVLNDKK